MLFVGGRSWAPSQLQIDAIYFIMRDSVEVVQQDDAWRNVSVNVEKVQVTFIATVLVLEFKAWRKSIKVHSVV